MAQVVGTVPSLDAQQHHENGFRLETDSGPERTACSRGVSR